MWSNSAYEEAKLKVLKENSTKKDGAVQVVDTEESQTPNTEIHI